MYTEVCQGVKGMEISLSFLENFIRADAWILIPVLYLIGMFLEQTPKVPEWVSPWVQMTIGIIFCLIYYGMIIQAVVQGILVAGAAVLFKDLVHKPIQAAKKSNKDNDQNDS